MCVRYIFTFLITFILLNVCIAVVLEAWEDAETTDSAEISDEALIDFCAAWQRCVRQ